MNAHRPCPILSQLYRERVGSRRAHKPDPSGNQPPGAPCPVFGTWVMRKAHLSLEERPGKKRKPVYRMRYTGKVKAYLPSPMKRISAVFFRTAAGGEPVREWLKGLEPVEDRKRIGIDIKTVEFGWPIGMPACRPLKDGLYEVRTNLVGGKIARVLFYIDRQSRMILLHGFIKKTQTTPDEDMNLARKNKRLHEAEMREMR
jgi:phage-related protein